MLYKGWSIKWELSDHSAISSWVRVDGCTGVVNCRDTIDWKSFTITVADESESWSNELLGDTAYNIQSDLRRRHQRILIMCGGRKGWWVGELSRKA